MRLYFSTAPADDAQFENTSIGYFHRSGKKYLYSEGMSYCCSIGAIFYTPNSEDEVQTLGSEFDFSSKYDDALQ